MSDLIDRQAAIDCCRNEWEEEVAERIEALPSIQPQSTMSQVTDAVQSAKDCISRQAAIDALGEKPLVWDDFSDFDLGKAAQWSDDVDAIKALPSAQPQLEECPIYGGMCGYPSNLCYECPRHEGAKEQPQWWTAGLQPFAQPQRMKGRWIDVTKTGGAELWKCSECGELELEDSYYCPNCGADMRGDEDAAD